MKTKILVLFALLLLAANCLGQTLTLSHQGFACPGGAHPWISGDVTNSVNHATSSLFKYTPSGGYEEIATGIINVSNYTSQVSVFTYSPSTPPTEIPVFLLNIFPRYEDECVLHTNTWYADRVIISGSQANGLAFNMTNWIAMAGSELNPFDDSYKFGAVKFNGTFEVSIDLFSSNTNELYDWGSTSMPGLYEGPNRLEEWIEYYERMKKPPFWWTGNSGGQVRGQMVGHHDQTFGLYSSTNLTSWTKVSNVVADEYGWVDAVLSTNLLATEQKFWQLVYTNSP